MTESFLKYFQFEKRVSSNTLIAYETDLKQFSSYLLSTYETQDPRDANHSMIRSWIVSLSDAGLDPRSINRKIACLRTYYKYLLKNQVITKNPMTKTRALKTSKKLPSFIKESEMTMLLDHAVMKDDLEGYRDKLILELFYGTGMRLSELIGLKEVNIDLNKRTIKVLGKRNKERIIPFPESLAQQIEQYRETRNRTIGKPDHEYFIVTDKGLPCSPAFVYRLVKKYLSLTSSAKRSPHVLRHTYATHLLNKGAEIGAVKDLLGHTSLAATQVYTHNSIEKIKKIFEQAHPKA